MSESIDETASHQPWRPANMGEYWREVGPKLRAIEREELRNFDYQRHLPAIEALLEIGVAYAEPRTNSGLVELQRRLRKLYS